MRLIASCLHSPMKYNFAFLRARSHCYTCTICESIFLWSTHQCLAIFFSDFFRSVRHYTYDITKAFVTVPKQLIIYLIIFKGKSSNDMDFTEYNLNLVSRKPISQHPSFPTNLDETKQISPDSAHPINSILLNSNQVRWLRICPSKEKTHN